MSRTQSSPVAASSSPRSLIERAADVYDFGAHLRERARPPVAVVVEPTIKSTDHPEPVEACPERSRGGLPPRSTNQDERAGLRQAQPDRGLGVADQEGRTGLRQAQPDRGLEGGSLDSIAPARPAPARQPTIAGQVDRTRLAEEGFIVPDAPVGAIAEEFRLVKRQLLRKSTADAQSRDRIVLVCSAQPNEGKTFCAVNLALSLASERDHEVLLVDADVAKPEVLSMLGLTLDAGTAGAGLMDAIGDPAIDIESLVIGTNIAKLSVLPAGRATNDDTEMLSSARAGALIEGLATANPRRIVIIDSAPALAASPAGVLAHYVGRVLMIVRADRTSESEVRDAVALLDGCSDIALLLNGTTFFATNRTYGSYYGADA